MPIWNLIDQGRQGATGKSSLLTKNTNKTRLCLTNGICTYKVLTSYVIFDIDNVVFEKSSSNKSVVSSNMRKFHDSQKTNTRKF